MTETEISFDQPRSGFGAWLGIVLLFFVFALFVWAVMKIVPHRDDYEKKRAEVRLEKLKPVREEAAKALSGYGWVDKSKGVVRLPIDRAMELTVAELAQKKPTVAYPIPPEPAAAAAVPAAAAAAATPAGSPAGSQPKPASIAGETSENRNQPTGAANPPNAAPSSQPGPSASPAASPPAPSSQARPNPAAPTVTPVQQPAGTPIPFPGTTPKP